MSQPQRGEVMVKNKLQEEISIHQEIKKPAVTPVFKKEFILKTIEREL
jgi:hypothetical protein